MIEAEKLAQLINIIEDDLLIHVKLRSIDDYDPIVAEHIPYPWTLIGSGNYAAVFSNPYYPEVVIKIYGEGRPGIEEEIEVYKRLGSNPAYSECFYHCSNYLVLKKLNGTTLYDAIKKGIQIPEKIIQDIDNALEYATARGLHPHDVHFKNVMVNNNSGIVVDVSDFYHKEHCMLWEHSKKAYYKIYLPFLYKLHPPIPDFLLNLVRKCYQLYKRTKGK
ncbi:serine/threonine protein kinase [Clostridium sp. YIM B02515]|uniref:Serine/threonine protein kinase n=1 Tax=Clostridium rhizosphaerae TaxID=2803861 RepID=A0ABS1TDM7_9CLOT|nr:serine/threonine-protein kinase [Clostridium rhizosphaerae]MBL4937454.1 serine/threonine protein kinase [Clostridium rhizosphaerae]